MSPIKLVPLTEDRTAEMADLWNKELGTVFPVRETLIRQNMFRDRNVLHEGSWAAVVEASDALAGFIVAKAWRDQAPGIDFGGEWGWINALLVDSGCRNQGVGGELLAKAEQALRMKGVKRISLGNDFHWRLFPGIPGDSQDTAAWFGKRGYGHQGTVHDLCKSYEPEEAVELPEFDGATFRLAQPDEKDRLIAFMKRCFPGRWEYQTIQYWERGGNGREFVVLEKDGDFIGFCRINDSRSPILAQNIYWSPLFEGEQGGIGPLGIDERFRGNRYGLAIVQAGIHYLLQRGARHIVIDTTPYVDFYGKHGYKVWKTYHRYEK